MGKLGPPISANALGNSVPIGYDPSSPTGPQDFPGEAFGGQAKDEIGIGAGERLMHNVIRTDAGYKHYLESHGYEVQGLVGYPGVFKVRKGPSEIWRVTDTQKGGAKEMFQDIGDLIGDTLIGGGATIGAGLGALIGSVIPGPGSFAGGAVGAGIGAKAVSEGLQRAGNVATGQQEYTPEQQSEDNSAGLTAGVADATLGAGAILAKKIVGPVMAETAASLSGIRNIPGTPRGKVLIELAMDAPSMSKVGEARSFRSATEPIIKFFEATKDEGVLGETKQLREMLLNAKAPDGSPLKMSMGDFEDFLRQHSAMEGPTGKMIAVSEEAAKLDPGSRLKNTAFLSDIEDNILGPAGENWRSLSPHTADLIRGRARDAGLAARAFTMVDERLLPLDTPQSRVFNRAYGKAIGSIDSAMAPSGDPGFNAQLYKELRHSQTQKMGYLDTMRDTFGGSEESAEVAAKWLYGAPTRESARIKVAEAAEGLGIDIKYIRRANLQQAATGDASVALSPYPLAGFSKNIKLGVLGGAAVGGAALGPPTAGVSMAGVALIGATSPKSAAMATRAVMQAGSALAKASPFLEGAGQTALSAMRAGRTLTSHDPVNPDEELNIVPRSTRKANITGGY